MTQGEVACIIEMDKEDELRVMKVIPAEQEGFTEETLSLAYLQGVLDCG